MAGGMAPAVAVRVAWQRRCLSCKCPPARSRGSGCCGCSRWGQLVLVPANQAHGLVADHILAQLLQRGVQGSSFALHTPGLCTEFITFGSEIREIVSKSPLFLCAPGWLQNHPLQSSCIKLVNRMTWWAQGEDHSEGLGAVDNTEVVFEIVVETGTGLESRGLFSQESSYL